MYIYIYLYIVYPCHAAAAKAGREREAQRGCSHARRVKTRKRPSAIYIYVCNQLCIYIVQIIIIMVQMLET